MDSFFVRYKNPLALIAILLAQTIGLAVQVRRPGDANDGHHVRLVRMWAASIAWPFEAMSHSIGRDFGSAWSNYVDLRNVRKQNRDLQQRVGELQQQEVKLAEDAQQGHRLQTLLQFQQQYVSKTVAAQVIGTSGADQSPVLYIDKGSADGLKPDMAVITPDGVVGKVRLVFPHESQVLQLNDPTSGAGVVLENARIRAVLRGTPTGKMQISNLTEDSRIKPGERVITSGGDQVYPRGLNVGVVESIRPDPDHQPYTAITIRPLAQMDRLEEVLVITQLQTTMPQQMQQDMNTAVEAAHAASVTAEQLPGINDPESGATATPATPGTPGAVPTIKPLTTIRPDRFTPGVTPPAASLTPGGANGSSGANAAGGVNAPSAAAPTQSPATAQPKALTPPKPRPTQPSKTQPSAGGTEPQQ